MNSFYIGYALNALILPPAIIGIRRYRSLMPADRVMVYILCLGSLAEILAFILALTIENNVAVYNIYSFFDAFLLAQVFFNWGCLKRTPRVFRLLQLILLSAWIFENHNMAGMLTPNQLFPVLYSCVLVFMGIDRINAFIVSERNDLLKNGRFLITLGVVISSSYEAFQDVVFWIYRDYSAQFYINFSETLQMVMIFVNILFLFAMLRLPGREKFVLPAR